MKHAESPRKRFDEMTRLEVLESMHTISANLRAERADLQAARRFDRDDVARIRQRILKLDTTVSAALLELAPRNERVREAESFLHVARQKLLADHFDQINEAAHALA